MTKRLGIFTKIWRQLRCSQVTKMTGGEERFVFVLALQSGAGGSDSQQGSSRTVLHEGEVESRR